MNTVFVTALTIVTTNKSNIQTLLITVHLNEESFWWLQCSIIYVQSLSSPTSWDSSRYPIALLRRRQHEVKTS